MYNFQINHDPPVPTSWDKDYDYVKLKAQQYLVEGQLEILRSHNFLYLKQQSDILGQTWVFCLPGTLLDLRLKIAIVPGPEGLKTIYTLTYTTREQSMEHVILRMEDIPFSTVFSQVLSNLVSSKNLLTISMDIPSCPPSFLNNVVRSRFPSKPVYNVCVFSEDEAKEWKAYLDDRKGGK